MAIENIIYTDAGIRSIISELNEKNHPLDSFSRLRPLTNDNFELFYDACGIFFTGLEINGDKAKFSIYNTNKQNEFEYISTDFFKYIERDSSACIANEKGKLVHPKTRQKLIQVPGNGLCFVLSRNCSIIGVWKDQPAEYFAFDYNRGILFISKPESDPEDKGIIYQSTAGFIRKDITSFVERSIDDFFNSLPKEIKLDLLNDTTIFSNLDKLMSDARLNSITGLGAKQILEELLKRAKKENEN